MLKALGISRLKALTVLLVSMTAAALNLIFQFIAGRRLDLNDFAVLSLAVSISSVISVSASGIQAAVATDLARNHERTFKPKFLDRITSTSLALFGLLGLLTALVSPVLASLFDTDTLVFLALALMFPVSAGYMIAYGRLQGVTKFRTVAVLGLILSAAKLSTLVIGVSLDFSVGEILLGVSSVSGLLVLGFLLATRFAGHVEIAAWEPRVWRAIGVQVTYWMLLTLGLVVARIEFSPQDSGRFALADLLAKMILVVPSLILLPLLPRYSLRRSTDESSLHLTLSVAGASLALMLIPVVFLVIGGDQAIGFLFGVDSILAPGFVGILAVQTIPFGLLGILIQFHLAAETKGAWLRLLVVLVLGTALLYAAANSFYVYAFVVGLFGYLAILVLIPKRTYLATWRYAIEKSSIHS